MSRKALFEKIVQMLKNEGAKKIVVFGSYLRGR